jgi:hypothetical protein
MLAAAEEIAGLESRNGRVKGAIEITRRPCHTRRLRPVDRSSTTCPTDRASAGCAWPATKIDLQICLDCKALLELGRRDPRLPFSAEVMRARRHRSVEPVILPIQCLRRW